MMLTLAARTCIPALPSHANTKAKGSTTVISAENSKVILCPVHRLTLRLLRAVTLHYEDVRKLLYHVYRAIRLHVFVNSIDVALVQWEVGGAL